MHVEKLEAIYGGLKICLYVRDRKYDSFHRNKFAEIAQNLKSLHEIVVAQYEVPPFLSLLNVLAILPLLFGFSQLRGVVFCNQPIVLQ